MELIVARIMHRLLSRSGESAGLTRRATEPPARVLYGTLRRPTERNTVRTSDLGDTVENLCIIRARFAAEGENGTFRLYGRGQIQIADCQQQLFLSLITVPLHSIGKIDLARTPYGISETTIFPPNGIHLRTVALHL